MSDEPSVEPSSNQKKSSTAAEDRKKAEEEHLSRGRAREAPERRGPPIGDVFAAYDENVGPLTPIIRDALMDAIDEFGPVVVLQKIREAVTHNKRSWAYLAAIFKRLREGGPERPAADAGAPEDDDARREMWRRAARELNDTGGVDPRYLHPLERALMGEGQ